jgi:hypothetical protein
LEELDVQNNQIKIWEAFDLPNLEILRLSWNFAVTKVVFTPNAHLKGHTQQMVAELTKAFKDFVWGRKAFWLMMWARANDAESDFAPLPKDLLYIIGEYVLGKSR